MALFHCSIFLFVPVVFDTYLQVLGVQSDVLFPVTQQREIEALLKEARKCSGLY